MIDFRIKKSSALIGRLTFQFVYDKSDNRSDHNANDFNFIDSIFVQEEAFFLIEPIFSTNESTERTPEQQQYYHWGLNYHDLNSLEIILQQIIELRRGIQQHKDLDAICSLNFTLSKKLKKILTIRRIRYKYQNEMVNYLTGIINFIKVAIDDKDIKGIWVIGI